MSESTIWFVVLSSVLATVLGVATFFIQKWISLVDETLKEHNTVIYKVSSQVSTLQSVQSSQTENLSETIRAETRRNSGATITGLSEIRQEVGTIKEVIQNKILPHVEQAKNQLGKVLILENQIDEQGKSVAKLYETLKLVIEKLPRQK